MSRIFLLQDRQSHLCCTGQVHQSSDSDWSTQKCLTEFKEQQIWTSAVQRRLMAGDHYRDGVGFECPLWSFSDCPLFSGQWPLTPLWVDALVDLALDADTADSVLFIVSCPESVHTTVTCDQDGGRRHFFMAYWKRFLVCGEADFLWLTDCGEMFWQPSHFGKYPQDWFQSAMTPWEVSNVARTSNFLQSPACNRQWIRFLFVSLFVWCLWDGQRVH